MDRGRRVRLASRAARTSYDIGLSYSTQDYQGGNPAALAAVTDGSRNVGELYAFDQLDGQPASHARLRRALRALRLSRSARGLLSPRLGVAVEAARQDTRIRTTSRSGWSRRAPKSSWRRTRPGPWLPPERTFAPLRDPAAIDAFRVERSRSFEAESSTSSTARSRWRSAGSISRSTISWSRSSAFGCPTARDRLGHYYVASAGGVEADGWAVRLNTPPNRRVKGSVHYSRTATRWANRNDSELLGGLVPALIRPDTEDLHDLTTSVDRGHPRNGDARLRPLQVQHRLRRIRERAGRRRTRRPLRRPGESGAALRLRRHEVGSARRRAQPLPRSHRSGLGLRRTARRPPAQAGGRRLPRSVLSTPSPPASRNPRRPRSPEPPGF